MKDNMPGKDTQLRQHQWMAFRRNPMFERNLGVKIFMCITFGMLALEFLAFGFFLDRLLLETGVYPLAIDVFNSIILYIFAADFMFKFFFKGDQSMQIAPYLTLPIKRNRLFDFLLRKEFTSFWNFYLLFLVIPFSFKAIPPFFDFGTALLYILFFYLLCVTNSLIVKIINNFIKKSFWFYAPLIILASLPFVFPWLLDIDLGGFMQQAGEQLLNNNLLFLAGLIVLFTALWLINRRQMHSGLYRELQEEKMKKIASFSHLSFLDRLGETGAFINLELKLITRAKRLKSQIYVLIFFLCYFFWQLYSDKSVFNTGGFSLLFFSIFTVAYLGLIMGQYIFLTESTFFDGLMSRKLSIYNLLKGKYMLYSSFSFLMTLILLIPVISGKLSLLTIISLLFFVTGPIYFLIFQNAVYNKMHFDIFEGGMMNWKGTSSNTMIITLITMIVPVIIVLIIQAVFGEKTGYWFMLLTGLAFTLAAPRWLKWTYHRFLKRKYKNMEGFRSNA